MYNFLKKATLLTGLLLSLATVTVTAQQSERFGNYELHFSVVNTTFLDPDVASQYGIVRGKRRGIVNIAVREHLEGKGDAEAPTVPMELKGRSWDLISEQPMNFLEINEDSAVYYIGDFKFINREWRWFELTFRPQGADKTYTHKFKHQLYIH